MTTQRKLLTAEELLLLPDDGHHYELIDGELHEVTPPGGEHGWVGGKVYFAVESYVRPRRLGFVLMGDTGVILRRNPDTVRGPDVCFIAANRLPAGRVPVTYLDVIPDFIVEIISPGDRPSEVRQKTGEWLTAGARLVWEVYPATRSVTAYRSLTDVRVFNYGDTIDGLPVFPDFSVPVAQLFD